MDGQTRWITDVVPEGEHVAPIGKTNVVRPGTDVTVVTRSLFACHALDVAEKLEPEGVDAEALVLRSLVPLAREAILDSVGRARRLVVDEDCLSFGLSGEISATITDRDPALLKAPVPRVAMPDIPIPYAHDLEYAVLPRQVRIKAAVRKVLV